MSDESKDLDVSDKKADINAEDLLEFIRKVELDEDGYITAVEFKKHFAGGQNPLGIKLTEDQSQEAITAMDKDEDGCFGFKEMIDWIEASNYLPESDGLGRMGRGSRRQARSTGTTNRLLGGLSRGSTGSSWPEPRKAAGPTRHHSNPSGAGKTNQSGTDHNEGFSRRKREDFRKKMGGDNREGEDDGGEDGGGRDGGKQNNAECSECGKPATRKCGKSLSSRKAGTCNRWLCATCKCKVYGH